MRIGVSSIFVNDQAKAQEFYTNTLGFITVEDIDLGEFRWLTVAGQGEREDERKFELVLEPNAHPAATSFQQAIYEDGIPATMFYSDDINTEYQALLDKGVMFKDKPVENAGMWTAIFDDTVGNWIQLVQV